MSEKLISSWHSSCVAMVIVVLFMPPAILPSNASSNLCDITDVLDPVQTKGGYFSWENDNSCFLFALQPATIKGAIRNCAKLGGHLTDIENDNNSTLQNYIKQEMGHSKVINKEYWIGLLYNDDLEYWYWVNDADLNLIEFPVLKEFYKTLYPICITLRYDELIHSYCGNTNHPYICKFDLGCTALDVNSTRCTKRCVDFISSSMAKRSSEPNTNEGVSNDYDNENHTDTVSTADGETTLNHSREGHTCDSDELSQRQVDIQNVVIVAVLGGVATILAVALAAACAIICKYRRLLRTMEHSPRISLVDILKADRTEARTTRLSQQSGSHRGSGTELLYSNADPNKIDQQTVTTLDFIYHSSLSGARRHSVTSETNPEKENNVYSHLNHRDGNLGNEESRALYDLNGASDLNEFQKEKSPTYEQYYL